MHTIDPKTLIDQFSRRALHQLRVARQFAEISAAGASEYVGRADAFTESASILAVAAGLAEFCELPLTR